MRRSYEAFVQVKFLPPAFLCDPRTTNPEPEVPIWICRRQTCISRTKQGALRCNLDTSFEGVSNRKLSRMRVVTGSGREGALDLEGSLAERELSFLVRLSQGASPTQKPDGLLELICGDGSSAMAAAAGSPVPGTT